MNEKFDELATVIAQSVTRRSALKNFGAGMAGALLTWLGFANYAQGGDRKCNQWHCANGLGDWDVYLCSPHRPKVHKTDTCVLIGPVDCSYCNSQCC